ncbi:MAG: aldo/keto reductase [Halioglobus sp.]|nr:aldo/keto reductase [Halioglobus sp.]
MINRRQVLQLGSGALACHSLGLAAGEGAQASALPLIQRPIPSTGEMLPVIGMGTSRTFDTGSGKAALANLREVMTAFTAGGGTIIDSSPMYGKAEARVGDVLRSMSPRPPVFAATKVWTKGRDKGIAQMQASAERMDVERLDLIAVHNLKDWKTHLATLRQWKEEGRVRYIGITTSHGRDHEEFLKVMKSEPLDFVQFSYNIEDRIAEQQLLPLAQDRGIATMINRPFQAGKLFRMVKGKELPEFAHEIGCNSWGQFFLKFILGHPAVTCIIPATSKVHHMRDNMAANVGVVPNAGYRIKMLRYLFRSF